jgi:bacterioferritin-associated ferredoxin
MYLCICKGITEENVRHQVRINASHLPAQEILKKLGVGTDCGVCLISAIEQIQQEMNSHQGHKDS